MTTARARGAAAREDSASSCQKDRPIAGEDRRIGSIAPKKLSDPRLAHHPGHPEAPVSRPAAVRAVAFAEPLQDEPPETGSGRRIPTDGPELLLPSPPELDPIAEAAADREGPRLTPASDGWARSGKAEEGGGIWRGGTLQPCLWTPGVPRRERVPGGRLVEAGVDDYVRSPAEPRLFPSRVRVGFRWVRADVNEPSQEARSWHLLPFGTPRLESTRNHGPGRNRLARSGALEG